MPSTDRGGAAVADTPSSPSAKAERVMMKAVAVFPGKPNSMHLAQLPSRRWTTSRTGAGCS